MPYPTYTPGRPLYGEAPSPGFLLQLGRLVDYPGRKIREALTGEEDASGRRLLEKMGLLAPNQEGFDAGDVAGFGAEVATDPLTYLSFGLTGAGRQAARLGRLAPEVKAAQYAAEFAPEVSRAAKAEEAIVLASKASELRQQLQTAGKATELAPTAAEQVRAGQRAIGLSVPFTDLEIPLVRSERLATAGEKVRKALGGEAPILGAPARGLRKLFDTSYGKSPELEPYLEQLLRRPGREALTRTGALGEEIEAGIEKAVAETGLPREVVQRQIMNAREVQNAPEILKNFQNIPEGSRPTMGAIAELPPSAYPLITKGAEVNKELLERSIARGARAPTNVLRSETKAYAERILTPEAKKWVKGEGKWDDLMRHVEGKVTTKSPSQLMREDALLEEFSTAVNDWFREQPGKPPGNWFEENMAKSLPQHVLQEERSIAAANTLHAVAKDFSRPIQPGDWPVGDFLEKGGFHKKLPELEGRGIPREIAEQVFATVKRFQAPEEIEKFWKVIDQATGAWRFAFTIPNPQYHFRNFVGNTLASALGGGADPRVLPEVLRALRNPEEVARLTERGVLTGTDAKWILDQIGIEGLGKLAQRFPKASKKLEKLTQSVEAFGRTWHYFSRLKAGDAPAEAVQSVRKYLFDYGDLTPFEKNIARRGILFYTWPKKMAALLAKEFTSNPRRTALLLRGSTLPSVKREGPVPEFVRQSAALPAGVDAEGNPRYVYGWGSPLEALNRFDFSSPEGYLHGGFRQLINQANPLLTIPAQLATGQDLFRDRPIITGDKAEPIYGAIPGVRELMGIREEKLPGGGTRIAGDPYANFIARSLPTQRAARSLGDLVDFLAELRGGNFEPAERATLPGVAESLFGVKTASLDEVDRERASMEDISTRLRGLEAQGKVRELSDFWAPGGKKTGDPEALALLAELRARQKKLKALRQENPGAP